MYVHSLSHFTLFGSIQAIFGQKREEMKPEIAPILSSWATKWAQNGLKTAPNGPKWSPKDPHKDVSVTWNDLYCLESIGLGLRFHWCQAQKTLKILLSPEHHLTYHWPLTNPYLTLIRRFFTSPYVHLGLLYASKEWKSLIWGTAHQKLWQTVK